MVFKNGQVQPNKSWQLKHVFFQCYIDLYDTTMFGVFSRGPHFQLLVAHLHALISKTVILMGMSGGAGGREYGAAGGAGAGI